MRKVVAKELTFSAAKVLPTIVLLDIAFYVKPAAFVDAWQLVKIFFGTTAVYFTGRIIDLYFER